MPGRRTLMLLVMVGAWGAWGCIPALPEDDDTAGDDDDTGDDDTGDDDTGDDDTGDDDTGDDDTGDDDTGDDDTGDDDTGDDDTSGTDDDGDGWTVEDGDCNDNDPTVHPGADEDCDGIDTDCDGVPGPEEIDDDGDGFSECQGDCVDFDYEIYPGAIEIPGDGIDQDCDGADPLASTYLYALLVEDYTDPAGLIAYEVDPVTAGLSPLPGAPWQLTADAAQSDGRSPMALDPLRRFLFVGGNKSNFIEAYRIDPVTGLLSAVPGTPFPLNGVPYDAEVDPSGSFLYVLNEWSEIDAFTIDPATGTLQDINGSPFPLGSYCFDIEIHPNGAELFSAHYYANVEVDTIDGNTGVLTYAESPMLVDPGRVKRLETDPLGEYVYVRDVDMGVYVLERNPLSGLWQQTNASPFAAEFNDGLAVHPTGDWLYVPEDPDTLSIWEVGPGFLWPAVGSPTLCGASPGDVAISPQGDTLFVAADQDDSIYRYIVDPVDGMPHLEGEQPSPANYWDFEALVVY